MGGEILEEAGKRLEETGGRLEEAGKGRGNTARLKITPTSVNSSATQRKYIVTTQAVFLKGNIPQVARGLVIDGKTKTKINPLKRLGLRPGVRLSAGSYKSELLTPQPKP